MTDQAIRPGPAPLVGLLPWQSYFLAFVLGIFSYHITTPALFALGVLYIADTNIRGWLHRLPIFAFVFCAAFGFGYASQRAPEPVDIPDWVETRRPVVIHGTVDQVEPRPNGRLRLILDDMTYRLGEDEAPLSGKLAWTWRKPDYAPAPGQDVSLTMRVVPVRNFGNPGGVDFELFWKRQGVFWRAWPAKRDTQITWGDRPKNFWWDAKTSLRTSVTSLLPETQGGAMVRALITGDRSGVDRATSNATRSAGLAHTLALSGLHVGFVAAMGWGLAWILGWMRPSILLRIPRPKLAVWLAAPLVIGYAWLGQPSQSLFRAAIMFGFWGFLLLQGRGRVLLDGLFFALAVIVFISPLAVFDLSLQMSASAVAGIGLMYPLVQRLLPSDYRWWTRLLRWAGSLLAISLCANIALLPIVSWNFGTWSPNILLNLIWLPVLGFGVMPLGLIGMLLSLLPWTTSVGSLLLSAASILMEWLLSLLHMMGDSGLTPIFSVLRPLWPEIVGVGLLLIVAVLAWSNRRPFVGLAGLGFLLMVGPPLSVMVADTQDEVRLSAIDVGLGQALLVSTPGGHRWLIDGGAGSKTFDLGEAVVAPYLAFGRPPRLDGVFLSHPDVDHSHGIPFILSRFDVGGFYTNGMLPKGRTGERLQKVMDKKGISPVTLYAGQNIGLGDGVSFEILHPSRSFKSRRGNERSLVMRLVRNGKPLALLTGDIEGKGIQKILGARDSLQAEVLVLPHHGSRSSYSPDLYAAVAPEAALCSNGYLNRYGFPHASVVRGVHVPVFATSQHGLVTSVWNMDNDLTVRAFWP